MQVTILGCGGSAGTPSVDKGWGRCDPENPRNRRLRPSILVEDGASVLLVDTSPDLRAQLLASGARRLDAVLFTHAHADHLAGVDDLRPINRLMDKALDGYADPVTLAALKARFPYLFEPLAEDAEVFYKATLVAHEIGPGQGLRIGAIEIAAFEQDHGYCKTLGFRFGPVAYSSDVLALPEASFAALEGVAVWIVGAFTDRPHPTHAHVEKALAWIERIKPKRAYLTHMGGDLDYETLRARLPEGVAPAYDGLVIDIGNGKITERSLTLDGKGAPKAMRKE